MAETTVKLTKPYTVHDETFSEIVLREPTYKEIYMDGMGKPVDVHVGRSGPMMITYPEVVDAYVQKLLMAPSYDQLAKLSSIDALKLEKAVCDFFLEWRAEKPSSEP